MQVDNKNKNDKYEWIKDKKTKPNLCYTNTIKG